MYEKVQRNPETTVREARCGDTWMRWNDSSKDSQELQAKDPVQSWAPELEPRAHEKKNACVARVKCARCGVLFTPTRAVPLSCAKPTTTENVTTPDRANGTTRRRLIGPKPVVEAFLQEAEDGKGRQIGFTGVHERERQQCQAEPT